MFRRIWFCILMSFLIVQSGFSAAAEASSTFTDIRGHWAQKEIDELASLGILKGSGNQAFYPDKPISRGEALAMLNRVFESVYGSIAVPERKKNLDYRYPLRWEIEQLLTNMRAMLQIETGNVGNNYDPGDRMLYYLYLADSGKLIKKQETENPDWWLSVTALQTPLTREEASLLLFHVFTPQKFRSANIKSEDAASYFTSFYAWKQDTYYQDTYSPFATAIREFQLFSSERTFEPAKIMSRAQYAVVLKRLHDFLQKDAAAQFAGNVTRQQKIAAVYLRAATLAYQTKNQARLSAYFSESALASLPKQPFVPKHTDHVSFTVRLDESGSKKMWVIGQYRDAVKGSYRIEYLFEPEETNPYGRKITGMIYTPK